MDIELIRAINRLWLPVYPGLARQAAEYAPAHLQTILEVGCFSGGTGLALLNMFPGSKLSLALEISELARSFSSDWVIDGNTAGRVKIISTQLVPLAAQDNFFDLVVCRGVFFFLEGHEKLLAEMYRVLAPGGRAFIGGGFGRHTPPWVIDPIADESRRLNYALGKQVITRNDFQALLARYALPAEILEDGGLWAVMRK